MKIKKKSITLLRSEVKKLTNAHIKTIEKLITKSGWTLEEDIGFRGLAVIYRNDGDCHDVEL